MVIEKALMLENSHSLFQKYSIDKPLNNYGGESYLKAGDSLVSQVGLNVGFHWPLDGKLQGDNSMSNSLQTPKQGKRYEFCNRAKMRPLRAATTT